MARGQLRHLEIDAKQPDYLAAKKWVRLDFACGSGAFFLLDGLKIRPPDLIGHPRRSQLDLVTVRA